MLYVWLCVCVRMCVCVRAATIYRYIVIHSTLIQYDSLSISYRYSLQCSKHTVYNEFKNSFLGSEEPSLMLLRSVELKRMNSSPTLNCC